MAIKLKRLQNEQELIDSHKKMGYDDESAKKMAELSIKRRKLNKRKQTKQEQEEFEDLQFQMDELSFLHKKKQRDKKKAEQEDKKKQQDEAIRKIYGENAPAWQKERDINKKQFDDEQDSIYKKYGWQKQGPRHWTGKKTTQEMKDELANSDKKYYDKMQLLNSKYKVDSPDSTKPSAPQIGIDDSKMAPDIREQGRLMDRFKPEGKKQRGRNLQQIQEENDIKEMLGDRYADYKAQMDALGPIKRLPSSSTLGGGKMMIPGEQGWEEQAAQRRAIRQQFGIDSATDPRLAFITKEKSPLQQFREARDNKRVDDMIAQYGSFDNYQNQMREQSRKRRIEAEIRRGDVDSAMALEEKFKQEDADRESRKTRLAEFQQKYGITPPVLDDRERFKQIIKPPQERNLLVPLESGSGLLGGSSTGALDPLAFFDPGQTRPTRPLGLVRPGFGSTGFFNTGSWKNPPPKPTRPPKPGFQWMLQNTSRHKDAAVEWRQVPIGPRLSVRQEKAAQQPTQQQPAQQAQPAAQQQPQQQPVQQPTQQVAQQPVQQQQTTIGPQQQYQQTQNQMYQTQPAQQQQPTAQQQPNQQQETEEEKRKRLEAATIGGASPPPSIT